MAWFGGVENLHKSKSPSLLQESYRIDVIILNAITAILTLEIELTERISEDAWFKAKANQPLLF